MAAASPWPDIGTHEITMSGQSDAPVISLGTETFPKVTRTLFFLCEKNPSVAFRHWA